MVFTFKNLEKVLLSQRDYSILAIDNNGDL